MEKIEKEIAELNVIIKEASEKVSNLEKLAKNSSFNYEEAEKLFLGLANGLKLKYEPNKITHYNEKGEWVIKEKYENGYILFSYYKFWQKFENIFGNNYEEIKEFLSGMVLKYMKIDGLTPKSFSLAINILVSKYMKIDGLTVRSGL